MPADRAAASPARVNTERLCDASDCTSSTRKPGTALRASVDPLDDVEPAAFADVGDTFDHGHGQ